MSFEIITKYFPDLPSDQLNKLQLLGPLYEEWNEKINVISRKDIEKIYERHILHSLAITKEFDFKPGTEILDIGTGGGFPGIPLAIIYPEVNFTLVDSIGKKIKVVQGIADELNLTNVTAIHNRGEKVKGQFDFIVCRAVTRLIKFIPWTKGKFKKKMINAFPNGIICLKGGDLKEEISEIKQDCTEFEIKKRFNEEFFETKKILYIQML